MADRWVIDPEHPEGHAVPMTAEEEARAAAERVQGKIDADADAARGATAATLRQQATAALDANAAFLALASPTAVQLRDQTVALTRECSALIRLLLGKLD